MRGVMQRLWSVLSTSIYLILITVGFVFGGLFLVITEFIHACYRFIFRKKQ
jgi:hypothetical protein